MIYLYCVSYFYELHKIIIDNILNKYEFIKKITINDENEMYEYIVKHDLFYKNNIYVGELEENLLVRMSNINKCNNMYLLNLKTLNSDENYHYINSNNINVMILDYNVKNINILKNNGYKNIIQLYCQRENIDKICDKTLDVAIVGPITENKNFLFKKLHFNNLKIEYVELNNMNIYKYKIILNIENDLDNITLENLICNKTLVIQNKSSNINYNLQLQKEEKIQNIVNKYTIDINYDGIPIFILFILKNYEQIHNNIYKTLNTETINVIKTESYKNLKEERNNIIFNEIEKRDRYGFIIIRHVNSAKTNNYWIECYKSIRKYYSNKIIIVDDNSKYDYVVMPEDLNIHNCEIIQSEYNLRGEILGYYYFHKTRPFNKAVVIHDSVFINKYIDYDNYGDIKFIWNFTSNWFNEGSEMNLINNIKNGNELKKYYHMRELINGCFGAQL